MKQIGTYPNFGWYVVSDTLPPENRPVITRVKYEKEEILIRKGEIYYDNKGMSVDRVPEYWKL